MKCSIHKADYCFETADGEHCCPYCKIILLEMMGYIVENPYTLLRG